MGKIIIEQTEDGMQVEINGYNGPDAINDLSKVISTLCKSMDLDFSEIMLCHLAQKSKKTSQELGELLAEELIKHRTKQGHHQ